MFSLLKKGRLKSLVSCLISSQSLWFPPFLLYALQSAFPASSLHSFFPLCLPYIALLCSECFLSLSSRSFPASTWPATTTSVFITWCPLHYCSPFTILQEQSLFLCSLFLIISLQSAMSISLCVDLSTRLNLMTTGIIPYFLSYSYDH